MRMWVIYRQNVPVGVVHAETEERARGKFARPWDVIAAPAGITDA
jgi:hypothetical protein